MTKESTTYTHLSLLRCCQCPDFMMCVISLIASVTLINLEQAIHIVINLTLRQYPITIETLNTNV